VSQDAPAAANPEAWTVKRVLEWTTQHLQKHGSDAARLEAEILLAHARKCKRIELYTHYDDVLTDAVRGQMRELVQRRAKREPVAYLVGHREFFSLDFCVTPDVLIPRPDTETLVLEAIAVAKPLPSPRILDLCTGSGCVAVALAKQLPAATLTAVDISPAALAIAGQNAVRHGVAGRITFVEGNLFQPLPADQRFDLIVSNPPYVSRAELAQLDDDVGKYEPRLALDGGEDGLDLIRPLVAEAMRWLVPGGWLFVELSVERAPETCAAAEQSGQYQSVEIIKDLAGKPRVLRARVRGAA
jgi:release factor glutamine methyltransferase